MIPLPRHILAQQCHFIRYAARSACRASRALIYANRWRPIIARGLAEGRDRDQSTLFPERLDEAIDADNPVRVVDAFIATPSTSRNACHEGRGAGRTRRGAQGQDAQLVGTRSEASGVGRETDLAHRPRCARDDFAKPQRLHGRLQRAERRRYEASSDRDARGDERRDRQGSPLADGRAGARGTER